MIKSFFEIESPSHTASVFKPDCFPELVNKTARKIRAIKKLFPAVEALAASGHSGCLLMGAVAYLLKMPQIAVRKSLDSKVDTRMVNGWINCRQYVIIDDLIDSGETVDRIVQSIRDVHDKKYREFARSLYQSNPLHKEAPVPAAIVLYNDDGRRLVRFGLDNQELLVPYYSLESKVEPPTETWGITNTPSGLSVS